MFVKLDLTKELSQIIVGSTFRFKINEKKERKKIQHKMSSIFKKNHLSHIGHEYIRAIGNAIKHGKCPVICTVYLGNHKRTIITIKDSGQGFNYAEVIEKLKQGKKYYQHGGCGMRSLSHNKHLSVDWQNGGKEIILFYH
jgi:signal transduction histidine kinase